MKNSASLVIGQVEHTYPGNLSEEATASLPLNHTDSEKLKLRDKEQKSQPVIFRSVKVTKVKIEELPGTEGGWRYLTTKSRSDQR